MSVESLRHDQNESRLLRENEKALLVALLSNRADFSCLEREIAVGRVFDMSDEGMGSVRFVACDDRIFGATAVEAAYFDVDGVLVSIAVNLDDQGGLYELDIWKTDFSPLKKYPTPEVVDVKRNVTGA